jgi:hypothetical protein
MATVTPNFNWPVPTSTDLVKDGATAIEALGDSIDASLVDLKGGTTGQVLSKTTNTDMDFTWVTTDDANAIQNTQLTAKGSLITAFSSATPATLTVGNNGETLVADSSTSTGLKWAAPVAISGPAFSAYVGTTQSFSSVTFTKIAFDTENFDTDSCFNTTNNRFTPTKAGYYQVNASILSSSNAMTRTLLRLYKNGSYFQSLWDCGNPPSVTTNLSGSTLMYLNGSTDYIELYIYTNGTLPVITAGAEAVQNNSFNAVWIRS